MGIKDLIERWKSNRSSKSEKLKEALEDYEVQKRVMDLQKSSNERELERFMKEHREDSIKRELEEFRKSRQNEYKYQHQILKTKNMFDPKYNKKSILKDKKLFTTEKRLFFHG